MREVGGLTMRRFDLLLARHEMAEKKARLNAGIIAAMVYNCAPFVEKKEAMHPLEFIGEKPEVDFSKMTPEEQQAYVLSSYAKKTERKR